MKKIPEFSFGERGLDAAQYHFERLGRSGNSPIVVLKGAPNSREMKLMPSNLSPNFGLETDLQGANYTTDVPEEEGAVALKTIYDIAKASITGLSGEPMVPLYKRRGTGFSIIPYDLSVQQIPMQYGTCKVWSYFYSPYDRDFELDSSEPNTIGAVYGVRLVSQGYGNIRAANSGVSKGAYTIARSNTASGTFEVGDVQVYLAQTSRGERSLLKPLSAPTLPIACNTLVFTSPSQSAVRTYFGPARLWC